MNRSKWILVAGLALTMGTTDALAEKLSLRYDVGVSGLRVMKVKFYSEFTSGKYSAVARLKPKGLFNVFMKKKLDLEVSGTFNSINPQPIVFHYQSKKKSKRKKAQVRWQNGKVVQWQATPTPGAGERKAIDAAIAKGALDPLSALFALARQDAKTLCTGRFHVFDGVDVYDLKLTQLGRTRIRNSSYSGPAMKCRMVYVPIAGMSERKKKKQLKNPPTFTLWMARVKSAALGPVWIPVQVTGRTKGKPFTASMVKGRMNGGRLQPAGW